jgi:MoaA/NifB/PqqE/SkfB family radical SAM enzyme
MSTQTNKIRFQDVYSPYKIIHHKQKLDAVQNGDIPFPVMIQVDITNECNLRCDFCFYMGKLCEPLSDWNPKASIPTNVILRLLEEWKDIGVKAIEWTGGGSVEKHPEYKKILRKSIALGFENALVTNGTLLDNEAIELIKDFNWVRFSIDSASRKTYQAVKGRDLFEIAIENIRKLNRIKNSTNVVGFSFVVDRLNYSEIYDAAKLAQSLGCSNLRLSLAMTKQKEKLFDTIWGDVIQNIELAKTLESKSFRIFSFSNRIHDLSRAQTSQFCYYHHFIGVVSPTGVYPCCRLKDDKKFNFGKINEQSFKEIWFGVKRSQFIKSIKNGCPFDCWMTEKNNFAHYLAQQKNEVAHVNFI